MTQTLRLSIIPALLTVAACITVNVYFPAAAAEKAADRIINEVYGKDAQGVDPTESDSNEQGLHLLPDETPQGFSLFDLLLPAAHAQQPNIDVSSPAISKLKASMKARHADLTTYYTSSAIGMTSNGSITLRDAKAVSIKERGRVNQLVSAENRDRDVLYAEIAKANGHPEWEQDIRDTFARRWVANAPAGWYFQDGAGNWKPK